MAEGEISNEQATQADTGAAAAQRHAARRAFLMGGAAVITLTGSATQALAKASKLCADAAAADSRTLFYKYTRGSLSNFSSTNFKKYLNGASPNGTAQQVRDFYASDGGAGYYDDLTKGTKTDVSVVCLLSKTTAMLPGTDRALV